MQRTKVNHQIQAPELRVINEDGEQIGIFSLKEALTLAGEHALDLVEVSPNAQPPVAKLINFDKYRYQQKKQEQQQKKKLKKVEVKTIRLSSRISEHDMKIKAKQVDGFIEEGNIVRVELRMRGREQAFGEVAEKQIQSFLGFITIPYRTEVPVKRMGGTLSLTLAPGK